MPADPIGFGQRGEWACPACEGDGRDPEHPEKSCSSCGGSGEYPGVANAWGQYGVSSIYVDVDGDDESDEPRELVCMDTFMCETSLTVVGAEEVAERLWSAARTIRDKHTENVRAQAIHAGEHFLEDVRDELGPRAYNCLRRAGVWTIEGSRRASDRELLAIPNLGRGTLAQIRKVCGG